MRATPRELETPCIESPFRKDRYGYGDYRKGKIRTKAHRFAYCEAKGIPLSEIAGLVVRHRCDNRACVNPEHLEIGTQKDNIRDAIERGSFTIGSNNGCAKLTEEQVKQIRNLAKTSTQRSLSKSFGVSTTQIWKIINRKKWAHIA